jgi:ATP-dependent RNA helicase
MESDSRQNNEKIFKKSKLFQEDEYIFETSEDVEVFPSFDDMGLKENLIKGIYSYGFDKPSAVQQRAIVPIISGRDVICQSQAGTGKTCVFTVGALQIIDLALKEPQVLILSPTRELAEQTQKVILALGDYMKIQALCCIGGKSVEDDLRMLNHGVHIISGTPGKFYNLLY